MPARKHFEVVLSNLERALCFHECACGARFGGEGINAHIARP